MPPRRELNERFQGYVRRAERVRNASTVFLTTLTLLAVVGGATLAFEDIAPDQFARLTSPVSGASSQLAAAVGTGYSWLDTIGSAIHRAVCPIFTDCETVAANSATSPQLVKQLPPSKSHSYQATTSPNVKQPELGTRAPQGAPATPVAGSNAFPSNQPATTIIREVRTVESGVNASYLDERLSVLQSSLLQRIAGMENANATSFRSVSSNVSAGSITGTITNAIESAVGAILDLSANTLTVTHDADVGGDLTVAGDATFGGTLTAGSLSVAALSSGGAVEAPYFTATSSTASSFAGGLLSLASTTIGNGTQAGGLTISGGATTTGQSYFVSANFPVVKERRTTTATGFLSSVSQVDRQTTGTAADGFGPGISFTLSDNTVSDSLLGRIAVGRNGAANSGRLSLATYNAGTSHENLEITANGNVGISYTTLGNYVSSEPTARLTVVATSSASTVPLFALQSANSSGVPQTSLLLVDSSGRVGIGTTNPAVPLAVNGSSGGDALYLLSNSGVIRSDLGLDGANGNTRWRGRDSSATVAFQFSANPVVASYINAGNFGIGTTTPATKLDVYAVGAAQARFYGRNTVGSVSTSDNGGTILIGGGQTSTFGAGIGYDASGRDLYIENFDNSGTGRDIVLRSKGAELLRLTGEGSLGLATTSPWRTLSVTGTVGFDGLTGSTGAGSLCLDSNKQVVYNSASDSCLSSTRTTKHEINPLVVEALEQVLALQPVSFIYNGSEQVRYGFIAEDTASVDGHLATYDASGAVSGIDDRSILAIVIGAFKALYARVEEYFARTERLEERVSALEAELAAVRTAESAGAPEGLSEAPTSGSASSLGSDTDSPITSTSAGVASSTADTVSPPSTDEPAPELAPANDNHPVEELPAAGTE